MEYPPMRGDLPTSPPRGYAAGEILHNGSEVVVLRARRLSDGLAVVLKGPIPGHVLPRTLLRLRHEHVITKEIAHPNVLRVLDVEENEGMPVLVLEDFGGTSLDVLLRSGRLGLSTCLRIAIRVADAIAALHHAGIIHKDVKPHNVLVRVDPLEVKLGDFGIATRLSQEAPRAENPDAAEGTLAYMSPEQTGWMNRSLDCRTDLYSLGVTLYEMVTGTPPFSAQSASDLLHCHLAKTPLPPHVRPDSAQQVPHVLSDIIMKLLSKAAEDRYQCADALKSDLEECLRQYELHGRIDPFPLNEHDAGGRLWIPEKLYGREAETQAIVAACEHAAAGAVELFTISGHAGIGKSALVREVYRVLARRPGYLVSGKFGQIKQRTPYSAIAQAFGELCESLLSEGEEALGGWRTRLGAALGSIGQVVVDVIPELARIIGPQPRVQPLGPEASRNRFGVAFQAFVRVIAEERLLVLFIDDLQWADPASLKLIELLTTDPEIRRVLVIGAYRDHEVDDGHPVARLLADVRGGRTPVCEVWLRPLGHEEIRRLVADTLHCRVEDTDALAALILERTAGNPFFIRQLLHSLADAGIVRFDPAAGAWTWDVERARLAAGADGVVELMAAKMQGLAPDTQRVLRLAACVGHHFDLRTLALLDERSPAEVAASLWEALKDSLVVPLNPEYRFVHAGDAVIAGRLLEDPTFRVTYRFLHDRVQQAAYALIDEPDRRRLHRRVGRLLAANAGESPSDEELFMIVGHLNLGAALIEGSAERREFVRRNLTAGRRAQAAAAYEAAYGYLSAAASALDPEFLTGEPDLVFDIQAERATYASLSGHHDDAEALFDALLDGAVSDLQRARVCVMQMSLYTALHRLTDTLAVGLKGLRLFGIEVPTEGPAVEVAHREALADVAARLGTMQMDTICAGPEITDLRTLAALDVLNELAPSVFYLNPMLTHLLCLKMVDMSLRYGSSPVASIAFVSYGFLLASSQGKAREGYRIAQVGFALNERYQVDRVKARLHLLFAATMRFVTSQREPLEMLDRARIIGLETGDFFGASAACNNLAQMRLSLSDELRRVREDIGGYLRFAYRTKDKGTIALQLVAQQVVMNLEGRTLGRDSLSGDGFDEEVFAPTLEAVGFAPPRCFYETHKLALAYLYGDYEGALRVARRAQAWAAALIGQYTSEVDLPLYTCLAILAAGPGPSGGEDEALAEMLASNHDKLAALARDCPELRHLDLLVQAERARVAGAELERILGLYQEASEAAAQAGYLRHRALVSELWGRFLASRRMPSLARPCLADAYEAYGRWGAAAKVRQMEGAYGELLLRAATSRPTGASLLSNLTQVASSTTEMGNRRAALLDAAALIRAAQAVASEVDLDRVMTRLLRLSLESVGAQRGVLILEHEGGPRVEAIVEGEGEVRVGPSTPLHESDATVASVIELVRSGRRPVVVGDAAQDVRFDGDPGVAARRPRSVLALPMASQGEFAGVLYLENNAAPHVFSLARLDVLELVAAQAAIAVRNALLYARVQAASEELRRANDVLEAAVSARTAELSTAKAQLEDELAERVRTEQARAALQENLIRMQRERLAELSTPLIPITDRIMVMPLIGTMDAQRADEALAAVLRRVADTGVHVVILDITGVRGVDSGVAATLLRTAAALRLLGAEAVLTGIRADVSQTLVGLGVDLRGIAVQGTLQRGMAYAIRKTGETLLGAAAGSRRREPLGVAPR